MNCIKNILLLLIFFQLLLLLLWSPYFKKCFFFQLCLLEKFYSANTKKYYHQQTIYCDACKFSFMVHILYIFFQSVFLILKPAFSLCYFIFYHIIFSISRCSSSLISFHRFIIQWFSFCLLSIVKYYISNNKSNYLFIWTQTCQKH